MSTIRRAVVVVLTLLAAACGRDQPEPPTKSAGTAVPAPGADHKDAGPGVVKIAPEMLRNLRITTAQVESRPSGEDVSVLGELRVNENRYAEVGSSVAARVTRVIASAGQSVARGQALAELQSMELGKARADYYSAQAQVELTQRAVQRKRDLAAERIAPQREVQEAEAELSSARAALRSAAAALRAFDVTAPGAPVEGDASRFTLRSPLAGVVVERAVVQGQMSDPAKPLFRIANLSDLWLMVYAYERDAVRIKAGVGARISLPALPGREFQGQVVLVGREVDTASRTIPIRVDVRNPDGALRPGMSATARIPIGEKTGSMMTVPAASVQRVEEDWCVFIPKDKSTFEIRRIGRGRDLGGELEVLSGLRAGETIVVEGAFLLKAEAEKAGGEGEHAH